MARTGIGLGCGVRFDGLVENLDMVDDRAVQVGLDCLIQARDVCQDRPDADAQQALAGAPAHAPCQQHLATLDGLHHAQMGRRSCVPAPAPTLYAGRKAAAP